jgi:heat shock protein HslJ
MKKYLSAVLIITMFTFFFNSCKSTEVQQIEGNWTTSAIEINKKELSVCPSTLIISKSNKNLYELNGNSGVNSFFASAKVKGTSFKLLNNMGSTKMLGDRESMEFEKNFTQILIEANSIKTFFEDSKEYLIIQSSSGKKLTFVKEN